MKKVLGLITLLVLFGCAENDPMYPTKAQFKSITLGELKTHLTYLASDEMRGRDTGSKEQNEAAVYIAAELKKYGYKAIDEDNSYFQKFNIYNNKYKMETLKMSFKGNMSVEFGKNVVLFDRSQSAVNINADVVYIVNGIHDDKIQQFDPEMVKGKIVVRMNVSDEQKEMKYNDRDITTKLTDEFGVAAIMTVMPDGEATDNMLNRYARWMARGGMTIDTKPGPVMVLAKESVFKDMLKRARMTRKSMSKSFSLGSKMSIMIENDQNAIPTQNVVGVLEGTDPELKNEYVAFSAHYDHVGVGRVVNNDSIYNGADDNGSGTTTLIEVAQAIAMKPAKRSIMFIWYTAEEKGLVGSDYYTRMNPIVPLENIVALFNIDMVGRSKMENDTIKARETLTMTDEIYAIGADKISQELHDINEAANKNLNMLTDRQDATFDINYKFNDEKDPNRFYYRSDHWNFAKNGVPIIFFFNGVHEDYHQASDHVDKIDFTKMRDVGSLAMATGVYIANKPERIKIDKKEEMKSE